GQEIAKIVRTRSGKCQASCDNAGVPKTISRPKPPPSDIAPGGEPTPEAGNCPTAAPSADGYTVPKDLNNRPIDAAVPSLFGVSWGEARKWIQTGKIAVDGERVTGTTTWVKTGQEIVRSMNARRAARGPELLSSQIVHLDSNVVVVNKPAGVSS